MKSADAIRMLQDVGFEIKRRGRGSHLILEKDFQRIVLSHPSELSPGIAGKVRSMVNRNK